MSVHLKHIAHTVKNLISADKYVFIGALIVIAGLFMPWFSINFSDLFAEEPEVTNAFMGLAYIVGYLCYFFTIMTINTIDKKLAVFVALIAFVLFLLTSLMDNSASKAVEDIGLFEVLLFLVCNIGFIFVLNNLKFFKRIPKNALNLFVGAENVILIFVASMIYHKESMGHTSANLNFGIYTSLGGAILLLYGAFLQMKIYKKATMKEVFSPLAEHLHGGISLKPDLNIDKSSENQNNEPAKKENSQLSFGDYE